MEDLLFLILQIVGEILLETLFGLLSDTSTYRLLNKPARNLWWLGCLALFAFGLLVGWASWDYMPHYLLGRPWLRLVNLVAAPCLAGYGALTLAEWRRDRGDGAVRPYRHFLYAFSASFGAVLARLCMGLS